MADLIERQAVKDAIGNVTLQVKGDQECGNAVSYIMGLLAPQIRQAINDVPEVDAVPMVQAHWIRVEGHQGCQCSFCGCWDAGSTVFCPHCGSFMAKDRIDMEGFMPLLKGGRPLDVAPVIRCRDCRRHKYGRFCDRTGVKACPNDFCSYAEPKEEDNGRSD